MKCMLLTLSAIVAMVHSNEDAALLLNGNTKLTAKLFSEVAKNNTEKSFVMSAFSLLTPLAQLSLGADGGTYDELLTAIGLPNDQSTINAFTEMKTKLGLLPGAELKIANRMYVSAEYSLDKDYSAMTRNVFDSEVTNADFKQPEKTATEINKWVEDHTNHHIKNLVDPNSLNKDTVVLLVNSVYFQSAWRMPFPKVLTLAEDFHVTKHNTVKVPMMRRNSQYKYVKSEELNSSIIEIPYVDNNSALYIILPNEVEGITHLKAKLNDPSVLEKALQEMQPVRIEVQIPRFTIETKIDLKEALPHVGVEKIFKRNESNLSKIVSGKSNNNLYIGQASQKAFVDVNEEGTAAGAANEFKAFMTATLGQKYFVANRPFVFDIRVNNALVFRGIYTAT